MDEIFKLFEDAQNLLDVNLISIHQKEEETKQQYSNNRSTRADNKIIGEQNHHYDMNQTLTQYEYRSSILDTIPEIKNIQSLQQKIINLKMNSVSTRRKDQLFKRFRKQQQQRIVQRRKQLEEQFAFNENQKQQGEFIIKRGQKQQRFTVKYQDFQKLKPETDLNDTIIDSYLKIMQLSIISQDIEDKTFIYSSFFMGKLLADCIQGQYGLDKESQSFIFKVRNKVKENYASIKRWTRRIDIFSKQFLIIPINAFKHWNCLVVVAPNTICNQTNFCKILYFDSMFEKRMMFPQALKAYLELQLIERKGITKSLQHLETHQLLVPRQTNTHDCGLYTLCYIQFFLMRRELGESDIGLIQNKNQLNLFPRSIIFTMRQCLRNMYYCLLKQDCKDQVMRNYMKVRQQIIKNSIQKIDYDQINQREFKKYYKINAHSCGQEDKMKESEIEFLCKIKFYLDCEVNHYQKDK